ncbi:MAG: universal stress protein [Nitrospirae bacterium]|nr:universal stress protein [Nitrospirota bacterium]MBI3594287.1 universal stress protein [Nitrospirota bacterium]
MARRKRVAAKIKKILVPTDFSPESERLLKYAVMTAKSFGARIHLFHAIEPFPYTTTDAFMVVDNSEALKSIADSLIKNFTSLLRKQGIPVKASMSVGSPAREIVMKAVQEKVDLIIMGTHGRTGVEHVLLGSVAEKVVRMAKCPVLTIR